MPNYEKAFTPTELKLLYTKLKIAYDPFDYSLKDRLIFEKDISDLTMPNFNFMSEKELLECLSKKLEIKYNNYSVKDIFENCQSVEIFTEDSKPLDVNDPMVIYKDNLYIHLQAFVNKIIHSMVPAKSLEDVNFFKDNLMLEALITLCIALRRPTSLIYNLGWLRFPKYAKYPLFDLDNLTFLESEVTKDNDDLQIYLDKMSSGILAPIQATDSLGEFSTSTICKGIYDTFIFGIEILNAIESIKNVKYKNILHSLFIAGVSSHSIICNLYTKNKSGTEYVINPTISKIVLEENSETRFEMIRTFMDSEKMIELIKHIADMYIDDSSIGVPNMFGQFLMYCQDLGTQSMRTKIILELYRICKKLDILKSSESLKSETYKYSLKIPKEFSETEESSKSEASIDSETKSKRKPRSMLHEHKSTKDLGSKSSSPSKESTTSTLEALDKMEASFKDGRYSFKVEDVSDTSERYKKLYDAIANEVHLINQNLIKRIKDIRTYNEGGKHPGMKSGKIDRKNIYRYKTTKDIFYNNTYKIKESDLAFGIILDVSGSMRGKGIENGMITMIILHETLKALGINHSIITHTTHGGMYTCEIKRYQAFKEDATYNVKKNYALASIEAESGNCDSAALYYMEKAFSRVRNKDKICIMFSDGSPTECKGTDLKEQVRIMERKGIKVIGVGIDFSSIKNYYSDYANGRNLKEMLDIVSKILEEYVLEKED